MRRLVSSLVIAVAAIGLTVAPAAALSIEEVPLGTYDFTVPADEGCADFEVLVEDISGRIFEIDLGTDRHGNHHAITSGPR
jgi:hypothetical protein